MGGCSVRIGKPDEHHQFPRPKMITFDTFSGDKIHDHDESSDSMKAPLIAEGDAVFEPPHDYDLFHENHQKNTHKPHSWLQLISQEDARAAILQRLMDLGSMNALLLSKATEDQIASAANDAIADEIMASVDREEQRRQRLTPYVQPIASYSPYRVLELVDVLDATTGGLVKRILTKVRQQSLYATPLTEQAIEFCRLCSAYVDHATAQHKCRICGVAGEHRSLHCSQRTLSNESIDSNVVQSPESKRFCSFCDAWVFHVSSQHKCRVCGVIGNHRSRNCTNHQPSSSSSSSASSSIRWRGSSVDAVNDRKYCEFCQTWRWHTTEEHRCRRCHQVGDHRSKQCTLHDTSHTSPNQQDDQKDQKDQKDPSYCSFCAKEAAHSSENHICHVCRAIGTHRSSDCPHKKREAQSVLSYSVETASKVVRDHVLERILPSNLMLQSMDKVGDVEMIVRQTLRRIGVWGGGSQTPITSSYAASSSSSSSSSSSLSVSSNGTDDHKLLTPEEPTKSQCYEPTVLAYAEGRSVVPERILKYMRLLMHHEVSTNAFSVVVRVNQWELERPGMVTPRSLPTSPTRQQQLRHRMNQFTLQILSGAREKLLQQIHAQRAIQKKRPVLLPNTEEHEE